MHAGCMIPCWRVRHGGTSWTIFRKILGAWPEAHSRDNDRSVFVPYRCYGNKLNLSNISKYVRKKQNEAGTYYAFEAMMIITTFKAAKGSPQGLALVTFQFKRRWSLFMYLSATFQSTPPAHNSSDSRWLERSLRRSHGTHKDDNVV